MRLHKKERDYFTGKLNLVFSFKPRNFGKSFNLIYYLILTSTLTLTSQLIRPNPNRKPHARKYIAQCSFSLRKIIFSGEIVSPNNIQLRY